ncbi:MAG: hypothetical protein LKE30_07845 [Bacteroidales bacterium]|jgi:hypothetical protein|nr:hypothetical protein [Bacteroidales bacterium]
MKKFLFFIITILSMIVIVTSCVDEDDFDTNRISQTTINPSFGANLLNVEFNLSDFMNFDSIADSTQGIDLVTINDANGDYMQLEVTKDFYLGVDKIDEFNKILPVEPVDFNLADVFIPSMGGISGYYTIVPQTDISIPVSPLEPIEQHRKIDSLILSSGLMNINTESQLPCNVKLVLSSESLIDRNTNKPYRDTITITNNTQTNSLDLTNYKIALTNKAGHGDTTYIDVQYSILAVLQGSTPSGNYHFDVSFGFTQCNIDLAYGKVGSTQIPINDSVTFNYLTNSDFAEIVKPNNIDLENIRMDVGVKTNIGLRSEIDLSNVTTLSSALRSRRVRLFPEHKIISLNRATSPTTEGQTTIQLNDINTKAIELLPNKIFYNISCNLYDDDIAPSFVYPNNSHISLTTKTTIPIKAIIDSLETSKRITDFDFITDTTDNSIGEYVKSAQLNVQLTNGFPAEMRLNFELKDEKGDKIDNLLDSPIHINSAPVDNNGKVLAPVTQKLQVEIPEYKYEELRKAKKVYISVVLKTGKSTDGQRHYIRFEKDAKLKMKLGIKARTNITF